MKLILYLFAIYPENRRSREGAWIEILTLAYGTGIKSGRSREGAWIEIKREIGHQMRVMVAPVRERGLKLTRLASS